jgi:hypothetical protein
VEGATETMRDLDTERLMNVARQVGFENAQKYDCFSVTEL